MIVYQPTVLAGFLPAGQQQPEVQQQGLEASRQWLQRGHKLIAATLTDSKQEATLEAELAAADTEQQEQQGMNSPELVQLKRDMLRVEALLAEQLQVSHCGAAPCSHILQALITPM